MKHLSLIFLIFSIFLLPSCKEEKKEIVTEQGLEEEIIDLVSEQKSMAILPDETQIQWSCSKPGDTHIGTVGISGGSVKYSGHTLLGARVQIDMNTIKVLDLDGKSRDRLESHLKGTTEGKEDDFFNVARYPFAVFNSMRMVPLKNDPDYNYLIYGYLTIKDVTKEIAFKASAEFEGGEVGIESEQFAINRTEWGIHYRSSSIFSGLKDRFIDDEINLVIVARASANI